MSKFNSKTEAAAALAALAVVMVIKLAVFAGLIAGAVWLVKAVWGA